LQLSAAQLQADLSFSCLVRNAPKCQLPNRTYAPPRLFHCLVQLIE
jgi:hypothetical protein